MSDAPTSTVDLGDGGGFRWKLWLYDDGTAQLLRQWPDRTVIGVVGRRPAAEVRAVLEEHGVSDEAWPA